jgi:hypothetical protein
MTTQVKCDNCGTVADINEDDDGCLPDDWNTLTLRGGHRVTAAVHLCSAECTTPDMMDRLKSIYSAGELREDRYRRRRAHRFS